MAGPLDIQRAPWGLLDALAMKSGGQSPAQLSPFLMACFDAGEMYLQGVRQFSYTSGINWANGWNQATQVPSGELWLLAGMALGVTTGVGVTASLAAAYQPPFNNTVPLPLGSYETVPASSAVLIGASYARGLVLGPGSLLGAWAHSVAGGVPTGSFRIDYYRLLV